MCGKLERREEEEASASGLLQSNYGILFSNNKLMGRGFVIAVFDL